MSSNVCLPLVRASPSLQWFGPMYTRAVQLLLWRTDLNAVFSLQLHSLNTDMVASLSRQQRLIIVILENELLNKIHSALSYSIGTNRLIKSNPANSSGLIKSIYFR